MKNITNLINKINALGEKQIFSPKQRKIILGVSYLLGMCFISITSISLLNVNANQGEVATFEVESVEEIISAETIEKLKETVTTEKTVSRKIIPKKVISKKIVPNKIISDEAIVKNSAKEILIISGEAIIGDFVAQNELGEGSLLDIMSIGQGSLIKGVANPESVVLIITRTGTECSAKTNTTGKFGCMFATEVVTEEDLQVTYN